MQAAANKNPYNPSKFGRDLPKTIEGPQKRNGIMAMKTMPKFNRLNSIGVKNSKVRGKVKLDSSDSSVKSDLESSSRASKSNLGLEVDQLEKIPEIESVHNWDGANLLADSKTVESERIIANTLPAGGEFEPKKSQIPDVYRMTVPINAPPPRSSILGTGFSILKKIRPEISQGFNPND